MECISKWKNDLSVTQDLMLYLDLAIVGLDTVYEWADASRAFVSGNFTVLIKVATTALNRADTLQHQGKYPPPKGDSEYPGLECSGTIEAVGNVILTEKLDQVCIGFIQAKGLILKCWL
ncbi:hypothetical protein FXO38_20007 [Capsicum annuum]|nr:hypothetical protein FXO38_20007 [Capsicum annuum]